MSKTASQYALFYTEEERNILRLTYSINFTKNDGRVRDIANALKGKCHDEAGILKAYYPYQTPEGRPLKRLRDKSTGKQVWRLIKITSPMAFQMLSKCLYAFIDDKYGSRPNIEIHNVGDLVEISEARHNQPPVSVTLTGVQIKGILEQIAAGKMNRKHVYQCCGNSFETLYEFRRHLFLEHPEELKKYFEVALTGGNVHKPTEAEVHKMASKGKRTKENALKKKEERQASKRNRDAYPVSSKGDHFHLIYTPMGKKR